MEGEMGIVDGDRTRDRRGRIGKERRKEGKRKRRKKEEEEEKLT